MMDLSDDSQAHARAAYPSELPVVRLTEVVRCTPRISLGCSDFALKRNQDGISCAHARPGPPLEARFFAAGAEATYATCGRTPYAAPPQSAPSSISLIALPTEVFEPARG